LGARAESVGFAFGCRTVNGFRRSRLMVGLWLGGKEKAGWEEGRGGGRGGGMEGWKDGRKARKGALGGREIKGWSVGVL